MLPKGDSRTGWLYAIFAASIGLLLLDAVLLSQDLSRLFDQQSRLAQAYGRIERIDGVLYRLTQVEAEQHAYLLTGRDHHIAAQDAAMDSLRANQQVLRRLYPDEHSALVVLSDSLVNATLATMGEPSRLYNQGDREKALALARTDTSHTLMGSTRAVLYTLRAGEEGRVRVALEQKSALQERVIATFAITTIIALGMIALLYLFVARDVQQRLRIERTLRQHRDDLDGRVQVRTRELLAANERLTHTIEELARSNRELEEFAYVASHDLQEPLRKLRVFSDLLLEQESGLSEDGRHFLGRVHHAAERMSNLINDLLAYSRVRSRQEPFAPVDLNVALREVLDDLEEALVESGASVEVGTLPPIEADGAQIRQLFHHLISNAIKFRRPEVPCLVRVEAEQIELDGEPYHRLYVHDNGLGFEQRYADRIFKPFQRLHAQAQYAGTGIGLAVCRRIAERHGAILTAESTPGNGATFCLTLPAAVRMQAKPVALPA